MDASGWPVPPRPCLEMRAGEIHVWRADLDRRPEDLNWFRQLLSEDERARAERFHFEADRNRFVAARAFLRTVLASYLDVQPDALRFCYGPHGKPALDAPAAALHFNMSHSDGCALLAVSRAGELGIDLERLRPVLELDGIARRHFSGRELAALSRLPGKERLEAFFRAWTRKEACLKAIGAGLSNPLDQFEVTLDPGQPPRVLAVCGDPAEAEHWSIFDLPAGGDYVAALATRAAGVSVLRWQWPG